MKKTLLKLLVALMMIITLLGVASVSVEAAGKNKTTSSYSSGKSKKNTKKKDKSSKKTSTKKKTKSSKKNSDPYDVHDYKSAEEFADDKYEEFYDYEDDYEDEDEAYDAAEEYWREHKGGK